MTADLEKMHDSLVPKNSSSLIIGDLCDAEIQVNAAAAFDSRYPKSIVFAL